MSWGIFWIVLILAAVGGAAAGVVAYRATKFAIARIWRKRKRSPDYDPWPVIEAWDPDDWFADSLDERRRGFVGDEYWLAWWWSGLHKNEWPYSDDYLDLALDLRRTLPATRIARAMQAVGAQIFHDLEIGVHE